MAAYASMHEIAMRHRLDKNYDYVMAFIMLWHLSLMTLYIYEMGRAIRSTPSLLHNYDV